MSSDPILGFPLIDPNQTGKTLTLNTAIDAIAQSIAGALSIDASANATPYTIPYSATPDEPAGTKTALRFFNLTITGALSGAWTAYMPAGQYAHFYVTNSTSGGYNITIMVSGQTGVTLAPGEVLECYLNGTDVVALASTGPINFTVSPTVPNLPYTDNSTKVGNTAFVQAVLAQSMAYSTWNIAGSGGVFSLYTLGSGATLTYTVAGGAVNGLTSFPALGSLYKVGDLLAVNGGNQDAYIRVATLSGSGVATGTIIYGGTGYAAAAGAALLSPGFAPFTLELHGALTGNVTIYLTYGTYITQGQQYIIFNNTTGAHTVTVQQAGAANTGTGTGVVIPQATSNSLGALITTDGETDVWFGSSYDLNKSLGTATITGNTAGTTDLTINPAFTAIGSSTILADFSPSFVDTTGGGTANTALALRVDPTIGATNSKNWTATFGLTGISVAPSITSGASGTITGVLGLGINVSNLAAGATLTAAVALEITAAVATGTITNNIGASISVGTAGTNNVNLLLGTATAPSGTWGIYQSDSAANLLTGSLQINGAFPLYLPFNNAVGGVIAGGVTAYFGPVGWYAFSSSQGWVQPWNGHVVKILVYFDNTPGVGQTYTVTYYENGSPTAMTGTCTNGNYSVILTGSLATTGGDSNNVAVITSAGATPTNVRGYMIIQP